MGSWRIYMVGVEIELPDGFDTQRGKRAIACLKGINQSGRKKRRVRRTDAWTGLEHWQDISRENPFRLPTCTSIAMRAEPQNYKSCQTLIVVHISRPT